MSLSSALSIAQSSLRNTSRQTSIVSRNVSDASNPDYTRRIAVVTSTAPGARSIEIQRAANELLFRKNNSGAVCAGTARARSTTAWSGSALRSTASTTRSSPATAIGELQEALQLYSALAVQPEPRRERRRRCAPGRANAERRHAGDPGFPRRRWTEIATAVSELNNLLASSRKPTTDIISGTRSGRDVSDSLDQRDALLKKISRIVPVSTYHARRQRHGHHDQGRRDAVRDRAAHRSALQPQRRLRGRHGRQFRLYRRHAGSQAAGGNTNASGKLAGLIQLRDSVAGTMQSQLDEIARGLVTAFAETAAGGPLPPRPASSPGPALRAMPAAGTLVNGLAGTISAQRRLSDSVGRRQSQTAARRRRQRRRLCCTTPAAAHPTQTC